MNDRCGHFREVGVVFDIFVPRNKRNGESMDFAFARHKIEWVVVRAIKLLQGRLIGGRNIQMAKYDRSNGNRSRASVSFR